MWGKYRVSYKVQPAPQVPPIVLSMTVFASNSADAELHVSSTLSRRLPSYEDRVEIISTTQLEVLEVKGDE